MKIEKTEIRDLLVIKPVVFKDDRGYFFESFSQKKYKEQGINLNFVQDNISKSQKNTIRGLHYQIGSSAQGKLCQVIIGKVLDVAVDIRKGSPTFLQWHGEELSEDNFKTMIIPEGFAHGFQTLTEDCEIFYLVSAPYMGAYEGAINPGDPIVSIKWPLNVSQLSDKDDSTPLVGQDFRGVEI